jgi:hypothetical protein
VDIGRRAGLPILPGLIRYDEYAAGAIDHAIRFTAPQTRKLHIWPARHDASPLTGAQYPPMGARFRLKSSVNENIVSRGESPGHPRVEEVRDDPRRQRKLMVCLRLPRFALG